MKVKSPRKYHVFYKIECQVRRDLCYKEPLTPLQETNKNNKNVITHWHKTRDHDKNTVFLPMLNNVNVKLMVENILGISTNK